MGNTIALVPFQRYLTLKKIRLNGHNIFGESDKYYSGLCTGIPTPFTLPARVCREPVAYTQNARDCVIFNLSNEGNEVSQAHLNWGQERELWDRVLKRPPFETWSAPSVPGVDDAQLELVQAGKQEEIYSLLLGRDIADLKGDGSQVAALIAGGWARNRQSRALYETLKGIAESHNIPYSGIFGSRSSPPCEVSVFSVPEENTTALSVKMQNDGGDIVDLSSLKGIMEKMEISPEDRLLVPGDKGYDSALDRLTAIAESLKVTSKEMPKAFHPASDRNEKPMNGRLARLWRGIIKDQQ